MAKEKKLKRVSFKEDTTDPKNTVKCVTCGHRNVAPKIRETFLCQKCNKLNCCQCVNGDNICCDCIMGCSPRELTEEGIKRINDTREGFKRYCVSCGIRVYRGTYCNVCQVRKGIDENGTRICEKVKTMNLY